MNETCYMCEAPATGREHVPPRCLFPESKDLPGTRYREKPIEVPSCERHNAGKAKDDEYLMQILPVYIHNNPVAKKHIDTKITRALKRRPKNAAKLVEGGGVLDSGRAYMSIDSDRIFNVCEHIAKGLFFHQLGRKWLLPIRFMTPAILPHNGNAQTYYEACLRFEQYAGILLDKGECVFHGEHPDIFKYKLCESKGEYLVVQLVFYDGVCVSGISRSNQEKL